MRDWMVRAEEAAQAIQARHPQAAGVGLILGSGWGDLVEALDGAVSIPYRDIPHFPASTVAWHAGVLWLGRLEGIPVAVMQGRFHLYEGYSSQEVAFPVMVLHRLGVRTLVVTNASGAINPDFRPGELMLITDHINFLGENPLTGLPDEPPLVRFPDMTYVYTPRLRQWAREAAQEAGLSLREGVYVAFHGPSFETPAEIRMARAWGADAVGMSSVPEAIMASALGMDVLGISCLSNMAAGILPQPLTAEEVMEVTQGAIASMMALIRGVMRRL